jgi:hypothetical protein
VTSDVDHARGVACLAADLDEALSLLASALEHDGDHAPKCKRGKRCRCWRARAEEMSLQHEPWRAH